jgi:glycosyltransferase involved in cell wall biosynthesis
MSLRSIGIDAESVCMFQHSFNYTNKSTALTTEQIKDKMREADVVQIMHSCSHSLNCYISSKTKAKLIVYHTGSIYRNNPDTFNHLFNGLVHKSVIALPEFAGLGSKNEQYIVGAIDTDKIQPRPSHPQIPLDIRHYPSNAEVKGTDKIKEMIDRVKYKDKFTFTTSSEVVDMTRQYERVNECDIYIELFKPILNNKPYGSFGIQALEAAAMGKIVVTQNINSDIYTNEYGGCKLILCDREADFIFNMELLVNLSPKSISRMQEETREWVVNNHSYKAAGQRIVEKVLS